MSRIYVTQLGERENIDQIFLAQEKQLRSNRNGNLYLQVRLSDKTGSLTGMMWNANERVYGSFEDGSYVRVQGTTQYYNNNLQMIINRIDRAEPGNVDEQEFVTVSSEQVDALASRLSELLRSMENEHLRNLAECFLMDEQFMGKFTEAPAGVKNHHAYRGGLLEHVVSLMEVVNVVSPCYEELDRDLMLAGALKERRFTAQLNIKIPGGVLHLHRNGDLVLYTSDRNTCIPAIPRWEPDQIQGRANVRVPRVGRHPPRVPG